MTLAACAEAVQVSPVRIARAVIRPFVPAMWRSRLNEPLGASVVRVAWITRRPSWRISTAHGTPVRFWSTSNSTSRRRLSCLTLSLDVLLTLHLPATRTPSPLLAEALWTVVAPSAAAMVKAAAMVLVVELIMTNSCFG